MWPYWLVFMVFALPALVQGRAMNGAAKNWTSPWIFAFLFLTLIIGLRFEVGGDWSTYYMHVANSLDLNFMEMILSVEPAYGLLNWISSRLNLGVYFVNLIGAGIFTYGLLVFARVQPRPALVVLVAVPYLITVVAMGYTRQAISIGLIMLAFVAVSEKRMYRYFLLMALAVLFHRSAIIVMPIIAFTTTSNKWIRYAMTTLVVAMIYLLVIQGSEEYYRSGYFDDGYASQGALMRISMNALPALLFLMLRKRFPLSDNDRKFWTAFALSALLFIPLLIISPSSTAVDRLALYWIPIQMFVLARLPEALGKKDGSNFGWVFLVILYCALLLAIWLLYAENARFWLPYKFYLWEWLWDFPYDTETAAEW